MTDHHCHRQDHREIICLKQSISLGAFVMSAPTIAKACGRVPDMLPPDTRNNAVGPAPFLEHP